jgi:hypothetical protein
MTGYVLLVSAGETSLTPPLTQVVTDSVESESEDALTLAK